MKERQKGMSEKEIIELLASRGKLIKRSLVTDDEKATVGYEEEHFLETWCR